MSEFGKNHFVTTPKKENDLVEHWAAQRAPNFVDITSGLLGKTLLSLPCSLLSPHSLLTPSTPYSLPLLPVCLPAWLPSTCTSRLWLLTSTCLLLVWGGTSPCWPVWVPATYLSSCRPGWLWVSLHSSLHYSPGTTHSTQCSPDHQGQMLQDLTCRDPVWIYSVDKCGLYPSSYQAVPLLMNGLPIPLGGSQNNKVPSQHKSRQSDKSGSMRNLTTTSSM